MKIDKAKLRLILDDLHSNNKDIDQTILEIEELENEAKEYEKDFNETKEKLNLSKAEIHTKYFFSDMEDRITTDKLNSGDPNWDENYELLKFENGRKLSLDIIVEEEQLTQYLFKWLYSVDDDGYSLLPFGCKLQSINFFHANSAEKNETKRKLIEMIESL